MHVRKTSLTLVLLYLCGLSLTVIAPLVLSQDYYIDANMVIDYMTGNETPPISPSFANTALLYRLMGFGSLWPDWLAGPFGYTVIFIALVVSTKLVRARWQPWIFLLLALWNMPLAAIDGTYSKELFAFVTVAAMLTLSTSLSGVLVAAALAAVYAVFLREYWMVIIVLWAVLMAVWHFGGGWSARMLAAIAALVPLSLLSHAYADLWLSDGRTIVVDYRAVYTSSVTLFGNLLPNTSPLTDIVNTIGGWLMVLFPVYLFQFGAVQHIFFGVFQLFNTLLFIAILHKVSRRSLQKPRDALAWRLAAASTWCVAYSLVQGMFEPDFGSFLKHELTLLPMLFFLLLEAAALKRHALAAAQPLQVETPANA